jgi:hypothetical protein
MCTDLSVQLCLHSCTTLISILLICEVHKILANYHANGSVASLFFVLIHYSSPCWPTHIIHFSFSKWSISELDVSNSDDFAQKLKQDKYVLVKDLQIKEYYCLSNFTCCQLGVAKMHNQLVMMNYNTFQSLSSKLPMALWKQVDFQRQIRELVLKTNWC